MKNNYDIYELISSNIKKYRKEKNLKQYELANKSGYSYEYIRRIESTKAKKCFSIQTIDIISSALEIPTYKLFIFDNKIGKESENNSE